MKSFRLAPESDEDGEAEDLDLQVAAELSAEELPHLATFPKLFAHADAFFQHLTAHWLRLTTPGHGKVRSRWPTDPTWEALRRDFARLADAPPLDAEGRELVRAHRYEGRQRLLRRMTLGVVKALEVQDASVASASLRQLGELMATKEAKRLEARKAAALEREGAVPPWVEAGMGASVEHPEKVEAPDPDAARHLRRTRRARPRRQARPQRGRPAHPAPGAAGGRGRGQGRRRPGAAPSTSPRSTSGRCLANLPRRRLSNTVKPS